MYYPNRQVVGDILAPKLTSYSNNETIIFCLKKSSLLSCIELAAHLHAYIYVLQYSEVNDPYNITRALGAVTSSGDFVLNPEISLIRLFRYMSHSIILKDIFQNAFMVPSVISRAKSLKSLFVRLMAVPISTR